MRTLAVAALLTIAAAGSLMGEGLTAGDRQRLLAHLDLTETWLADEVDGLTPAQLTYRMTPESWHIMDVVEHLAIAEPQYWKQLRDSVEKQPIVAKASDITDGDILWYGIDRTRRQRTGEPRVPKGRYGSMSESLRAFRKLRAEMRDYATGTQHDLRGRRLLEGNMDVYQWFLMISSHAQRHILQIREIKAHAGFPKG
jgi:hypothetical protein